MTATAILSAPPAVRFTEAEAERAHDAFGFNCGPAAVCGLLELTPDELRPHLSEFEKRGYTNPTTMYGILRSLGRTWTAKNTSLGGDNVWPYFGLARIQWAGPWTEPGVPIGARYRKTHWVASFEPSHDADRHMVFDVNAMVVGGWIGLLRWKTRLVPWLLKECEPKATGEWWITHSLEITESRA